MADKKHTFVVHNRQELLTALGDSNNDTLKLICIVGCIDMNAAANGHELALVDYATAGYPWDSYLKQYNPQNLGQKDNSFRKAGKATASLTKKSESSNNYQCSLQYNNLWFTKCSNLGR